MRTASALIEWTSLSIIPEPLSLGPRQFCFPRGGRPLQADTCCAHVPDSGSAAQLVEVEEVVEQIVEANTMDSGVMGQ